MRDETPHSPYKLPAGLNVILVWAATHARPAASTSGLLKGAKTK